MKNPKEILNSMIETHGYKGLIIFKDENDMFIVRSLNYIPAIILYFIFENYTVNYSSKKYIEFYQFE